MNTPASSIYKPWLLALATAAALLEPQNVSAQAIRTWLGTTGSWETVSNWSVNTVPSGTDWVTIKNGGTATISSAVASVNRIYIGGATLSQLNINSGGSLQVTGDSLIRVGQSANDKGAITVTGGTLQNSSSALYLGVQDNTRATLTIKNGGAVTSVSTVLMGAAARSDIVATLNIGGESGAEGAGWLDATKLVGYNSTAGTAHTNVVNFNHTSSRYVFTKTSAGSSDAVVLDGHIKVNAKAGVTVLTGSNKYTQGTTVSNGAVLLANYAISSGTYSSTGSGSVDVQAGGTLGGVGYVGGSTTVSGILKPGDYDYDAASPSFAILKFAGNLTLGDESSTIIGINGGVRGTSYSAINVAGNFVLDGELTIQLWDDFAIADGDTVSFQIFSGQQSITGSYDTYTLPDTWNGLDLVWNTATLGSTGYVSVNAIPEPLSGVLVLGGAAIFLAGRRFRMSGASMRG